MVFRSLERLLMPTIGLIVEGAYDEVAIPVLLKRCRNGVKVITRKCRGSVTGKFLGLLAELGQSHRTDKVLIVSDADGREPRTVLSAIQRRLVGNYRFIVTPLIIVEMLEAWLIADPEALETILGVKTSFVHPERIRDPKAELRRLFAQRSAYTPEIARRIAEEIDLELLARRCPKFLVFREAVLDP